jgi:predicted nucleotidyltransferase
MAQTVSATPSRRTRRTPPRRKPRLPRKASQALANFQRRALALFPDEISQIIPYGSYARGEGEATPESDADVIVVGKWRTSKNSIGGPGDAHWKKLVNAAVDSRVTGGPFISVMVTGEDLFNSGFSIAETAIAKVDEILAK